MGSRGTRTRLLRRRVLVYVVVAFVSAAVLIGDGWAYFTK